jgi:hypothetical protein
VSCHCQSHVVLSGRPSNGMSVLQNDVTVEGAACGCAAKQKIILLPYSPATTESDVTFFNGNVAMRCL